VDTFVAPPRPFNQQETEAFKIARGLDVGGGALGELFQTINADRTREAQIKAETELNSMSPDQVHALVANGEINEFEDPYRRRAMQTLVGRRVGFERVRRLVSEYGNIADPSAVNIDQFLSEGFSQDADLSEDTDFLSGYNGATREITDRLRVGHDEALNEQASEVAQSEVYMSWRSEMEAGIAEGASPATIVAGIINGRDGVSSLLGVSRPQQNEIIMGLVENFAAEGETELVDLLLDSHLGPDAGPLGGITQYRNRAAGARVTALNVSNVDQANLNSDNQARWGLEAESGQLETAEVDAAFDGGDGWLSEPARRSLQVRNQRAVVAQEREIRVGLVRADARGGLEQSVMSDANAGRLGRIPLDETEVTIFAGTPDEERISWPSERARDIFVIEQATMDAERRWPDSQAQQEAYIVRMHADNGITNQTWAGTLNTAYSAIPEDAGGETNETLKEAFDLYNNLFAIAPNYVGQLTANSEVGRFYELHRTLSNSGLTPDQAMNDTIRASFTARAGLSVPAGAINEQINDQLSEATNAGQVLSDVGPLARGLFASGRYTVEEAVTAAVTSYEQRTMLLNGAYIQTNDATLPENFGMVATAYLDNIARQEGMDTEDVYLTREGVDGNRWFVYARNGGPIGDDQIGGVHFIADMESNWDAYETAQRDEILAYINDRSSRYSAEWTTDIGHGSGLGPTLGVEPYNPADFRVQ
jgi:hypothetical protein